ncbi:cupin-like domain-containing protein [Pseudomonas mosselii]|uniref:cupin-like domain-containing protein n=1 Tax=Pseudomonas mosselii TaxID=78327 RepID=UPI0015E8EAA7|nr:cupin-like domain-containing protein [Pseudomonas mosselii]
MPFIIEGIVKTWPINTYHPDDLYHDFGMLRVVPRYGDHVPPIMSDGSAPTDMSLQEYLDLIYHNDYSVPPYIGDHPLPIDSLCEWPPYFERWHTPRVWLGPAGTVTCLHCDYEDNLFAQVWGRKRFLLASPATLGNLYVEAVKPTLSISSFDPDQPDYEKYPLARAVDFIECIVQPGDLLYLPAGWFHHVTALDFSLSINRWMPGTSLALACAALKDT